MFSDLETLGRGAGQGCERGAWEREGFLPYFVGWTGVGDSLHFLFSDQNPASSTTEGSILILVFCLQII